MGKEKTKQEYEYALKLAQAIMEVLNDEDSENFIDREELIEGENLTHFIHALSNLAPSLVYTNITGDKKSSLSFNYLANQLFFQYSEKGE